MATPRHCLLRIADEDRQAVHLFGAGQPGECLLYAINGGRDEVWCAGSTAMSRSMEYLDRGGDGVDQSMRWLARLRERAQIIHYARQVCLRGVWMALHDGDVERIRAPASPLVVADCWRRFVTRVKGSATSGHRRGSSGKGSMCLSATTTTIRTRLVGHHQVQGPPSA